MNPLLQNELLSAYLDGELSAAEQAEIERLLASNPAARKLLDELRALSAALQTLPQEKVGEDLTEAVLHEAQRRQRMQAATDREDLPMPLGRSIARRLLNRRGLAWAGLAVAIAILIGIHERGQNIGPVGQAGREMARAPGRAKDLSEKTAEAPMIRAIERSEAAPTSDSFSIAAKSELAESEAAARPAEKPADSAPAGREVLRGREEKRADSLKAPAFEPPPAAAAPAVPMPRKGAVVGKGGATSDYGLEQGGERYDEINAKAKRPAAETPSLAEKTPLKEAEGWQGDDADALGQQMLVVQCEITLEAAKHRAFDQLLLSNGIAVEDQPAAGPLADEAKEEAKRIIEREATADLKLDLEDAAKEEWRNVDVVYVEATPDQIEATLNSLTSQPTNYRAVSIAPVEDKNAQTVLYQNARGTTQRSSGMRQSAPIAEPENLAQSLGRKMQSKESSQPQSSLGERGERQVFASNAQRIAVPGPVRVQSQRNVAFGDMRANAPQSQAYFDGRSQSQVRQSVQPSTRQQVLFVLRTADLASPAEAATPPAVESKSGQ